MNLTEKAVEIYEKEKELIKEREMREVEKFANDALKVLRDIIGEDCGDIITLSMLPDDISFRVDGILFRATSSCGHPNINVATKCPMCEAEIVSRVTSIRDIGRALAEPHFRYDCDKNIRLKKEYEDRKNGKILSTDERLLEAFRDFVSENMNIE